MGLAPETTPSRASHLRGFTKLRAKFNSRQRKRALESQWESKEGNSAWGTLCISKNDWLESSSLLFGIGWTAFPHPPSPLFCLGTSDWLLLGSGWAGLGIVITDWWIWAPGGSSQSKEPVPSSLCPVSRPVRFPPSSRARMVKKKKRARGGEGGRGMCVRLERASQASSSQRAPSARTRASCPWRCLRCLKLQNPLRSWGNYRSSWFRSPGVPEGRVAVARRLWPFASLQRGD